MLCLAVRRRAAWTPSAIKAMASSPSTPSDTTGKAKGSARVWYTAPVPKPDSPFTVLKSAMHV
jgi:hypothetical protein